jgi:hypothetical protein
MEEKARVRGRAFAALLSLLAWVAVSLQLGLSLQLVRMQGGGIADALVVVLGYFTILSNLFVALIAGAAALSPGSRAASPMLRGCATAAIVVVGLGYHLLLRQIWDPQGWQWVADNLLHYAVPILALAHWWLFPPQKRLPKRAPLLWALYPAAYLAYALIRGEWIGAYPYPFIDVPALGHARVFANAAGLLLVFLAVGAVLRLAARRR